MLFQCGEDGKHFSRHCIRSWLYFVCKIHLGIPLKAHSLVFTFVACGMCPKINKPFLTYINHFKIFTVVLSSIRTPCTVMKNMD